MKNYAELLFTDSVRALQDEAGVGAKFEAVYRQRTRDSLSEEELGFIATRRSFYLASVSADGWPYVQHRGGPRGFLKALGSNQLGFADYRGNRQFITMGHSARDNRVALILMDYENRERLKLLGRLTMIPIEDAEARVVAELATEGEGKIERIALLDVVAFDWNCQQFIPRLIEAERLEAALAENERLRRRCGIPPTELV
ncbi:MAG: pyridoxamine 5'-phosphate oxidase family protein [Verrucomicrobiales bacterium]